MSLRSTIQNRLGAQGYENIGEKRYAMQGYVANGDLEIEGALPWTRVPYFVCAITTGIGTALAYPTLLLAVMPLAFFGAVLPYNPLDYLYNYGIRRFTGTGKIPRQGNPRRFACGLAAAWLIATAFAFQAGYAPVGYVLGGSLAAIAGLVAITNICIPSTVYALVFGGPAACEKGYSR